MSDCGDTPEIVFRVICFFAIVFNVLFFLLIRYKTPRTMTAYSKVLYTSCIFDGLASISHFLIGNRPLFVKDVLANDFVGPIPRLFAHMEWISDEGYAYFIALEFLFQFSTLSVCFVPCTYRFFHYIRNTTFTRFKFGLLLLVYLIPPFMVAIPFAMLSALVYTPMKGYIGRSGLECTTWFPAIDGRIYKEEQLSSLVDIPYKFGQLLSLFPIFFIYFLIRIFVKLNEDVKKLSSAAGRMQKEITVTLTAQAVIPLLFTSFPVFYASYTFGHQGDKEGAMRLVIYSVTLFTLVNPIASSLLVKNYRHTIWRVVCFGKMKEKCVRNPTSRITSEIKILSSKL
uniref:G_PROTEIN_RECEP_F1_2 domain-containing protein n=1 Tax=Bursaphelenchus xylophilus TaxID=6326 RepID=A0A1I7SF20_BURXY